MRISNCYAAVAAVMLTTSAQAADVGQDAIDACIDALRAQAGGGGGMVLSTEFSEANSLVMLQDASGASWKCLVANSGVNPYLEPAGGAPSNAGMAGPSHWEVNVDTTLNIHSSPSTSAPTVARLPRGMVVENRGCLDEGGRTWCEVADGDASGWAAQEFLIPSDGVASQMPAAAPAEPASGTEVVRFGSGRSGTDLSGRLEPGGAKTYVLGAADGQTLYVEFWTTDPAIEYQIFLPDGKTLLDMMTNTQRYEGSLFMSGDHRIEVINRSGSTASYNMSVEIR
jgi:hypothetical protein